MQQSARRAEPELGNCAPVCTQSRGRCWAAMHQSERRAEAGVGKFCTSDMRTGLARSEDRVGTKTGRPIFGLDLLMDTLSEVKVTALVHATL